MYGVNFRLPKEWLGVFITYLEILFLRQRRFILDINIVSTSVNYVIDFFIYISTLFINSTMITYSSSDVFFSNIYLSTMSNVSYCIPPIPLAKRYTHAYKIFQIDTTEQEIRQDVPGAE